MLQSLSTQRQDALIAAVPILDALLVPVLVLNGHDTVDYANTAAAKLFDGWASGRSFEDLFPEYARSALSNSPASATINAPTFRVT